MTHGEVRRKKTGNTNRWNAAKFCHRTARLTRQNVTPKPQTKNPRAVPAPEFLIFHFTCQEPQSHKEATSFKSEYSSGAHRRPWDRQTYQMLLWMDLFLLNHYKKNEWNMQRTGTAKQNFSHAMMFDVWCITHEAGVAAAAFSNFSFSISTFLCSACWATPFARAW